jgi:hypothetical protein
LAAFNSELMSSIDDKVNEESHDITVSESELNVQSLNVKEPSKEIPAVEGLQISFSFSHFSFFLLFLFEFITNFTYRYIK